MRNVRNNMEKNSVWKRIWKVAKYIVIPAALMILLSALYKWADDVAMGGVADWIDKNMMIEYNTTSADGQEMFVRMIDWPEFKYYFMEIMLITVPIICIVFLIIIDWKIRKTRRQDTAKISGYIDRFIIDDEPFPADIPSEYAEVFAKLSEVKYEEQKKEQEMLAETTRKDDLVTYLAHDLKTPLTSVIGYLTLLKDEPRLSDEMRSRYTEIAVNKSERLEELINELFEITRYNIHHFELEKGKVNLSIMLEQILFEFGPMLSEKHLHFESDIAPDIDAYIDADKMERVIDNLIRNAVHYSYPDTEIKVRLSRNIKAQQDESKDNITLQVVNKGKTIPGEKLDRIFEQFYRVDSSRSSATGGSGLGLAIARQLVEAHGGCISAESENEEIRFTVKIPTGINDGSN